MSNGWGEAPSAFDNPERIDLDDPPSKRILAVLPAYAKVASAVQTAMEIGIASLRASCTHFAEWLGRLEALGGSSA